MHSDLNVQVYYNPLLICYSITNYMQALPVKTPQDISQPFYNVFLYRVLPVNTCTCKQITFR